MKSRLTPPVLQALRSARRPTPPSTTNPFTRTRPNAPQHQQQTRPLIAAPKPNSGPLLHRHPNRALPPLNTATRTWALTIPLFLLCITGSALAIFNYEKTSSSVVSATLYSLRIHPGARELLGDEIYFRDRWPWVWGELNQVHGRIDIGYGVKGTRGRGYMRFRAERRGREGYFETREWSLEMEDGGRKGEVVGLLEGEGADKGGRDPFGREVQEGS